MASKSKAGGPVVGIDIGSSLIKAVEAKLGKTGIQVTGLAIAPTPEGVLENGVVTNPAALGSAIKKLLNENGIKAKQCVSAVAGQSSVVLRVIEVPKMTRDELKETMKWEVERHVPFSPTEVIMDFQPLERPNQAADAQNMEVLLAVAQQDMINGHVEALMSAGLKPMAIDVEPLAAGRALIELSENGTQQENVAVLEIGAVNTTFCIFENGMLTFPNPPLPVAGVNLTRAISETLNEDMELAERLKKELAKVDLEHMAAAASGFAADEPDAGSPGLETIGFGTQASFGAPPLSQPELEPAPPPLADGLDVSPWAAGTAGQSFTDTLDGPVFDLGNEPAAQDTPAPIFDLSEEPEPAPPSGGPSLQAAAPAASGDLRAQVSEAIAPVLVDLVTELRRALDYYRTRYQTQPSVVYLSGGTARIANLDKFLANELAIPVVIADPMANVSVTSKRYSPQYLSEVSPLFTVSIGLAVRDMLE